MKVFIVADLEGCCGVVAGPSETRDGEAMAGDVNAAIDGAFAGGATEVVVRDFHCSGRNIPPESLDPRASLIRGSGIPGAGAEFDSSFDVLFLVGFHCPTEEPLGVTPHTFDDGYRVFINGSELGEAEVFAALAFEEGIAVGLVSGDERFVQRFKQYIPSALAVTTKQALSSASAVCRAPSVVREELRQAAKAAVSALPSHQKLPLSAPYCLEVHLPSTQHALAAQWVPGIERTGPCQVKFESTSMRQVFSLIYLLVGISSIVADWK